MPPFTLPERLPEFLYPWGAGAYRERLLECIRLYGIRGSQGYCTDLLVWHEILHFFGSLGFVAFIHVCRGISTRVAVTVTILFTFFFAYQELIDQPVRLDQTLEKGLLDLTIWLVPVAIYWGVEQYLRYYMRKSLIDAEHDSLVP